MDRSRRKFVVLTALALAVLGMVAACGGGGDDDDDYDFNGTWVQTLQVVQSNVPGYPVGKTINVTEAITQSGANITVASVGMPTMTGVCDTKAGTYSVSAVFAGSVFAESGTKVDHDTMSGQYSQTAGPYLVRWSFTSQLASRNRAAAPSAQGGVPKAAPLP